MAMEAPASMICHSAAAFTEYFSCTTATVNVCSFGFVMVIIRVVM